MPSNGLPPHGQQGATPPPPPPKRSHSPFDLIDGLEFTGQQTGKQYLARWWGEEMWLFRKHPDGQWVSWRKVTADDLEKITKAGLEARVLISF